MKPGEPRRHRRRILLILDKCGPGEAVRASPMLGAVRVANPAAFVTLLVGEQAYPLFLDDTRFDRIVCSGLYGRRPRRLRRLGQLATAGALAISLGFDYDLVITFLWGSSVLNLIGRIAGRRHRIGYPHRFPALLTSRMREYDRGGDVAANLALLHAAGIAPPNEHTPALALSGSDRLAAEHLLSSRGRRPGRPLVMLHSGSDWACQQWLPERWALLADRIANEHGADIVFTGVSAEEAYIEAIRQRMVSPSISLAGATDLHLLAAVTALAGLCVSVDSAAHDLAQALGVPVVVLAGPTIPEAPRGGRLNVVNQTHPDLRRRILACQSRFPLGFCHDYSCPWAGMTGITADHAFEQISRLGLLPAASRTPLPPSMSESSRAAFRP